MADTHSEADVRLYLLLTGAMLVGKTVRDEVFRRVPIEDIPPLLVELWKAMRSETQDNVKSALASWGVPMNEETSLRSLTRVLQQRALSTYCRSTIGRCEHAKGVDPQNLLTLLDAMRTNIAARMAALEPPKPAA